MTSFYAEQRKSFKEIAELLNYAKANKISISINKLIYDITSKYEIGEGTIRKRLKLICELEPQWQLVDDELFWGTKE